MPLLYSMYRRLDDIFSNTLSEPELDENARLVLKKVFSMMRSPNVNRPPWSVRCVTRNKNEITIPRETSIPTDPRSQIRSSRGTFLVYSLLMFEKTQVDIFLLRFNESQHYVERVVRYLTFILPLVYASGKMIPKLSIYLLMTDCKKIMPPDIQSLGTNDINSAFTLTGGTDDPVVVIFREEEWLKVFIHETFHALCLDFSNLESGMLARIEAKTGIESLPDGRRTYETYCETFAVIVHSLFMSDTFSAALDRLRHEQLFSALQCAKLMPFVDGRNAHTTAVGAYHVLKFALLNRMGDFIRLQSKKCESVGVCERFFSIRPDEVEMFDKLIVDSWYNTSTQDLIKKAEQFLSNASPADKLVKTLRMSCGGVPPPHPLPGASPGPRLPPLN